MWKVQVSNMALAYEGNTDLAFDTTVLRNYGNKYAEIAKKLNSMATDLDNCLQQLEESGWTTPAGTAFHKMAQTNWKENIEKYADLLDTLKDILDQASSKYDVLVTNHIEMTKI